MDESRHDKSSAPPSPRPATRAGYVALLGRPNAGKSTLMNALVGEKLSIVTPRAQTTWQRVTGIRTTASYQMIFLDTPGLLHARDLHQRSMLGEAHAALEDADVVLLILDPTRALDAPAAEVVRTSLALARAPVVAAINKADEASGRQLELAERWVAQEVRGRALRVSALRGEGFGPLLEALAERLPESPFFFPEDDLATQPVRFFVQELIREVVFEQFADEVPWSVAARVDEFRESEDPVYIGLTLYVERDSQKGILLGSGGRAIRQLGMEARQRIETFLGTRVYLDLWVKVLRGWRRRHRHLTRLGYKVPEEDDA
jgi:GTP-binding protein Era